MKIIKFIGKITPIAKIKKGKNYLSPEIDIVADEALEIKTKERLINFLNGWLDELYFGKIN